MSYEHNRSDLARLQRQFGQQRNTDYYGVYGFPSRRNGPDRSQRSMNQGPPVPDYSQMPGMPGMPPLSSQQMGQQSMQGMFTATGLPLYYAMMIEASNESRPMLKTLEANDIAVWLQAFEIYEEENRMSIGLLFSNVALCLTKEIKVRLRELGVPTTDRNEVLWKLDELMTAHNKSRTDKMLSEMRAIKYKNVGNIPNSVQAFNQIVDNAVRGIRLNKFADEELCGILIRKLPVEMTLGEVRRTQKERNWKQWRYMRQQLLLLADALAKTCPTSSLLRTFGENDQRVPTTRGYTIEILEELEQRKRLAAM